MQIQSFDGFTSMRVVFTYKETFNFSGKRTRKIWQQPVYKVQNPVESLRLIQRYRGRGRGQNYPHLRVQHQGAAGGQKIFHQSVLWKS